MPEMVPGGTANVSIASSSDNGNKAVASANFAGACLSKEAPPPPKKKSGKGKWKSYAEQQVVWETGRGKSLSRRGSGRVLGVLTGLALHWKDQVADTPLGKEMQRSYKKRSVERGARESTRTEWDKVFS
jgi:hypothetical protein